MLPRFESGQNKAALLDELGRFEEALACDDAILQRDPDNPQHLENRARRLKLLRDQKKPRNPTPARATPATDEQL